MSTLLLPASALPPLPVLELPEAERRRLDAFPRLSPLPGMIDRLTQDGWAFAAAGEHLLFFDRPGYWLRIYDSRGDWYSTIEPYTRRAHRSYLGFPLGYNLEFAAEHQPPTIQGRGAMARALELAKSIFADQHVALEEAGAPLASVGVRMFAGTGRGGGISTRWFGRTLCMAAA